MKDQNKTLRNLVRGYVYCGPMPGSLLFAIQAYEDYDRGDYASGILTTVTTAGIVYFGLRLLRAFSDESH